MIQRHDHHDQAAQQIDGIQALARSQTRRRREADWRSSVRKSSHVAPAGQRSSDSSKIQARRLLDNQIDFGHFRLHRRSFRALAPEKIMLGNLLERWPLVRQLRNGDLRATGETAWSERTRNLKPRHHDSEQTRSICPYCGVGCGQVIYHKDNRLVQIEGDPASPVSRGHLCPKGANTLELHTHRDRLTKVKYRRPYSDHWEDLDLDVAMEMIAQ